MAEQGLAGARLAWPERASETLGRSVRVSLGPVLVEPVVSAAARPGDQWPRAARMAHTIPVPRSTSAGASSTMEVS